MNVRSKRTVLTIYTVVMITYIVIFLAIPFEKNSTNCVAFVFGCISIIAGAVVSFISFDKGENLKSKVYGFPMFRLGYYYTIAQIVVSLVIIVIASFYDIPTWISIIAGVILLAIVIAGTVAVDTTKDYIVQQETRDVEKTKAFESFRVDIDSLVRKCTDENVKKELEKLAEKFKYSDPVSSDKTREIENKINELISELSDAISRDSVNVKAISDISNLLSERNGICKQFKS